MVARKTYLNCLHAFFCYFLLPSTSWWDAHATASRTRDSVGSWYPNLRFCADKPMTQAFLCLMWAVVCYPKFSLTIYDNHYYILNILKGTQSRENYLFVNPTFWPCCIGRGRGKTDIDNHEILVEVIFNDYHQWWDLFT